MSPATNRLLLGRKTLRGSGSGGKPDIGKMSVGECEEQIRNNLKDTDILFIVAGLGKGTGSGASPEIAKIAKSMGILTVAIVNFPSISAEGREIYENALESFEQLKKEVDSITRISNDKIINNNAGQLSFVDAFEKANHEVENTISEIVDMIGNATEMNIDFADIRNFFVENKIFLSGSFMLYDEYDKENLKQSIQLSVEQSYSDVEIQTQKTKVMMNLSMNSKTPNSVISDIRNIFKDISSNNSLSLVYGADYQSKDGIKAFFIVSAYIDKEQELEAEGEISKPTKTGKINDYFGFFGDIDENSRVEQYRTTKIDVRTTGVKHKSIQLNTSGIPMMDITTNDAKSTQELLTKAIHGAIKSTDQKPS
ncbi:cell division protein FtsZ [Bacilli bacterium]|nr:cell division protein FtsZ [Bacilli bacterium]